MDLKTHVHEQLIRHLVGRCLGICPITGKSFDVRNAHIFRDSDGDPVFVMHPDAYEALTADQLEAVTDAGWVLDTRGAL